MTQTKKLETYEEVRDFVFLQLDQTYIRPGAQSRDDADTWIEIMGSRTGDGSWIFRVHHEGDGLFTSTIGFHYDDDTKAGHYIGLAETKHPVPAKDVPEVVAQAHIEVFLGVIPQVTHEEYDELTRTLPLEES